MFECIINDISEQIIQERKTRFEADRDPLTQLLNRRGGRIRINKILKKAKKENRQCAFLLIDLDKFKPVNDQFGHEAGDMVLKEVARRLCSSLRDDDLVIRWGGDEFLVVIIQGHDPLQAPPVSEKILRNLEQKIDIGENNLVSIEASIGISLFPEHGKEPDQLILLADNAMYLAKKQGRNAFHIHQT